MNSSEVKPSKEDKMTQGIQSVLGPYDKVMEALLVEPKGLIGVDQAVSSPSTKPPNPFSASSEFPVPKRSSIGPRVHMDGSKNQLVPSRVPGVFSKPLENKYVPRGSSSHTRHNGGPVIQNGASKASPPPHAISNSLHPGAPHSRINLVGRNLPRLNVEQQLPNPPVNSVGANAAAGNGAVELEHIFKEMTAVAPPVTAIATPRKEPDSKFTFNPILSNSMKESISMPIKAALSMIPEIPEKPPPPIEPIKS
ncbi:hypothetical protein J437_LFUL011719, partial [Ladona fulva]